MKINSAKEKVLDDFMKTVSEQFMVFAGKGKTYPLMMLPNRVGRWSGYEVEWPKTIIPTLGKNTINFNVIRKVR